MHGAAGTDVRLRFAEVLNPDGTVYVDNLRTAKATDHYILSGKGSETFQPDFTFHGFRYVEVTGLSAKPDLSAVKAVALYTDAPITVQLKSGSSMINQLWSNILWGQRSNFVGVPTDCPQRDERFGWTADAQVFWRTASFNMDLTQFSQKFARDIRTTQAGTLGVRYLRTRTNHAQSRFCRGLERCRCDYSLDVLGSDGRHTRRQRELGVDGEVSRRHSGRQPGLSLEEQHRHSVR